MSLEINVVYSSLEDATFRFVLLWQKGSATLWKPNRSWSSWWTGSPVFVEPDKSSGWAGCTTATSSGTVRTNRRTRPSLRTRRRTTKRQRRRRSVCHFSKLLIKTGLFFPDSKKNSRKFFHHNSRPIFVRTQGFLTITQRNFIISLKSGKIPLN